MADPKSLDEALRLLQADPPVLLKDKKGQVGNQKTKYADLVQVNAVVLSRLNALGVIYKTKPTLRADEPKFVLDYSLKHVPSGTEEAGQYPLKLSENPMQMGSAITYARRYVLLALTGIAAEDEDDDGHMASHRGAVQRSQSRHRGSPPAHQAARPPLPGEGASPEQINRQQLTKLHAVFSAIGWEDRADRLRATSAIVGRPLASANDLTRDEAGALIDELEKVAATSDPAVRLEELVAEKRKAPAAATAEAPDPRSSAKTPLREE